MKPTEERDRILAKHLASRWLEGELIQTKAVAQLSKLAKGSAIWLQMASNSLREACVRNEYGIKQRLEALKTSPSVISLYKDLFDSPSVQANEETVEKALETLAVARRPLSIGELSYAVFIDVCGPNLDELNQAAESVDLLTLLRPFISVTNVSTSERVGLRLVHQSLLELILTAPPTQWKSLINTSPKDQRNNENAREQRRASLEADMLNRCVKYLLFEEFKERKLASALPDELFGIETEEDAFAGMAMDDTDDELDQSPQSEVPSGVPLGLYPEDLGFGKFFAYAGAYWTDHIAATPLDLRPKVTDLVALCGKGTRRLENWVEMWKRPTSSYFEERPFLQFWESDPLIVMAYFDPQPTALARIAKAVKDSPDSFVEDPEWALLKFLARYNCFAEILGVLKDPYIGAIVLCSPWFLTNALQTWLPIDSATRCSWDAWEEIFEFVIPNLGHKLVESAHHTLRLACQKGCLTLVKKLFRAGAELPELCDQMLSIQEPRKGYSPRIAHQSVGEAAAWGHSEIVRFLCAQEGIKAHVQWINAFGRTVFHQAAQMASASHELFKILIPIWPDGLRLFDQEGETALTLFLFNSGTHHAEDAEVLKTLLRTGHFSPAYLAANAIHIAAGKPSIQMCRSLIIDGGVDPWVVIDVDSKTGKPISLLGPTHEGMKREAELLRRSLCTLMPLAVSTEHLF